MDAPVDTDDTLSLSAPSPEETLALTRELVARSRSTLREVDRRLSGDAGTEVPRPNGSDATV